MDITDEPFPQLDDSKSCAGTDAYLSFASTDPSSSNVHSQPAMLNDPFEQKKTNSSPSDHKPNESASNIVLGQLAFAPATQTTVVTTTTTTTTNFPPLMMKAPKHLHELDSTLYPLAASPTPASLKRLSFKVGGRPAIFREAEDPDVTLQMLQQQQMELQDSDGMIRSVARFRTNLQTPQRRGSDMAAPSQSKDSSRLVLAPGSSRVTKAPILGQPNTRSHSTQAGTGRSSRLSSGQVSSCQVDFTRPSKSSSRLQIVQTSTPITPSLTSRNENERERERIAVQGRRSMVAMPPSDNTLTPEVDDQGFQQTLSPNYSPSSPRPEAENLYAPTSPKHEETSPTFSPSSPGAKSPVFRPEHSFQSSGGPSYRPRPTALDTTAAQDASLPSPSLSPVTAAANLHSRRGYFDESLGANNGGVPEESPEFSGLNGLGLWRDGQPNSHDLTTLSAGNAGQLQNVTMMDIPTILDSFEAMPTDMKKYVMFQLLRRCPKPVLHSVADTVNPALKCDFISLLPAELSQVIIGNLGLKTLCRASQVSKKWRQVIDTDEKTWKNLFDAEGFKVSPAEMRRAILEGWGWQPWSSLHETEEDISNLEGNTDKRSIPLVDLESALGSSATPEPALPPSHGKRSKRKITKSRMSSRKQPKKKITMSSEVAEYDLMALKRHITSVEGPYAAAKAGLIAVPTSNIGLPSLRSLTLFKSIYRRHHLVSESWMQDEVKPRHLAFKAHSRHVVTCLQFDSDKILTGSDDTNINVYDTRTGALRAKLQGHEGGVWALQYVGNILVSGSTDRSVRIWDIEQGVCMHVFQGHTSTVRCLIILMPAVVGKTATGKPIMMPREPMVITGSRDSTLRVWKLPKQGEPSPRATAADDESPYFVRALNGHIHSVRAIAAHGDTLVSGSYDSTVRVWRISTGETVHRLTGHSQKVYSVVLDHERNRCISGSMDNLVKVWCLDTGTVMYNLEGHLSLVGLLDLQRDRLVSAAADSTLRIWDPANGHCKSTLRAHTGAITCFQHDGNKVISGSDRNLKMWNIQTGEFVRDLLTDLSGVWQVNFDERRCVAAVQRDNLTYIEILDFGASRDGVSASKRGRRIVVDTNGDEVVDVHDINGDEVVDVHDTIDGAADEEEL